MALKLSEYTEHLSLSWNMKKKNQPKPQLPNELALKVEGTDEM